MKSQKNKAGAAELSEIKALKDRCRITQVLRY